MRVLFYDLLWLEVYVYMVVVKRIIINKEIDYGRE